MLQRKVWLHHLADWGCDAFLPLHMCRTIADECCFQPPPSPGVINYMLHDWVERDLCSSRPWLVLHKVPYCYPTVGQKLQYSIRWHWLESCSTILVSYRILDESAAQVVETEQMVFLGERVRNCTVTSADAITEMSTVALPAAGSAVQT